MNRRQLEAPDKNWKTKCSVSTVNFLSLFDLVEGQPNMADMLNQQFTKSGNVISGGISFWWADGYTGDPFQGTALLGTPIMSTVTIVTSLYK